jgi:hypothetical protein
MTRMKWIDWPSPHAAISNNGYRVELDWEARGEWMWCAPGGSWQRDGHDWAGDAQQACEEHFRQTGGKWEPMRTMQKDEPLPLVDAGASRQCLDHFDEPHRYPSGVHAESFAHATMDVPLLGRSFTVLTRQCERCGRKVFGCDCGFSMRWLDWPDPWRTCTHCGRTWRLKSVAGSGADGAL